MTASVESKAAASASGRSRSPEPKGLHREPARELRALLEERAGERHAVAIQDFPDPDAISSALAYREIAAAFDVAVDILYEGLISHPENLALVNLLEIELTPYHEEVDLADYDAAVFVDNQGTTTRLMPRLRGYLNAAVEVSEYAEPDPLFLEERSTIRADAVAGLRYSLRDDLTLGTEVAYTRSDSNIVLYDYDRVVASVSLSLDF